MQTKLFICFALYVVSVASEPTTYIGQAGKDIKLPCRSDISGDLYWKHDGTNIISVDKSGRQTTGNVDIAKRVKLHGTTLQISNLQPTDKGTFKCLITDRNRNQKSSEHKLLVHKVSVSVSPASPLLLPTEATLTCEASDSPSSVKWKHMDGIERNETVVQLKSVETSHAGKWTCVVSYKDVTFEESLDINVIGLKTYDTVSVKQGLNADLPCLLTTSNFGSLDVVGGGWKRLSPPSADASWLPSLDISKDLRWKSDKGKKVTFSKEKLGTNLNITLLKVKAEDAGQYQCYIEFKDKRTLTADVTLEVIGVGGVGGVGGARGGDTPSEGSTGKNPPSWLGLNMWIWVGVGAGSVVIIALIVAIVLVHRSNRRKKMRMRKLKSVRKPLTPNDYCQCNRQPRGDNMNRPARVPRQQRIPENIQINGGHGRRSRM